MAPKNKKGFLIHIGSKNRENIEGQVNGKFYKFQPDETVEVEEDVLGALRNSYVEFEMVEEAAAPLAKVEPAKQEESDESKEADEK